jgi:hypothetical protein
MSLRSRLVRWLRRPSPLDREAPRRAPLPPVSPGPRKTAWLVVAPGDASSEHNRRACRIAEALARRGLETSFVSRGPCAVPPTPGAGLRVVPNWDLSEQKAAYRDCVDRVRVLVSVADAESVALARELASRGARITYDAPRPPTLPAPATSYEAQTERALVDHVEDLVASDTRTARHLMVQAGGNRLVHVVASPGSSQEADRAAGSLVELGGRPSVAVLLAAPGTAGGGLAVAESFLAAREGEGGLPYHLAVVVDGREPAEALEELEDQGRIRLLRSARAGREAAWELGAAATRSELVALVDGGCRPDGSGWLRSALEVLASGREIGAVGTRSAWPGERLGATVADASSRPTTIDFRGMVLPRAVLRRCGGLERPPALAGLAAVDFCLAIHDLGLGVVDRDAPGLELAADGPRAREPEPGALRALRLRWAHHPDYFRSSGGA